jgi:hypothetical protein
LFVLIVAAFLIAAAWHGQSPKVDDRPVIAPHISVPMPAYLDYAGIGLQCSQWQDEAPELVVLGTYGKSKRGADLRFVRLHNKRLPVQHKIMVTACIHGNEPLSTGTVMAFAGRLLSGYGTDAKDVLDSAEIVVIPVVSPDSYPSSRQVDGVDPNRNFDSETPSPTIAALKAIFESERFCAAASGHTHGRVFLTPWGEKNDPCPNEADYQRVVGKMRELSGYRQIRACEMYGKPIQGSEVDWYYKHGAFAIVIEFGTHQQIPSKADIADEFNRTWPAFLHFLNEAPKVKVKP